MESQFTILFNKNIQGTASPEEVQRFLHMVAEKEHAAELEQLVAAHFQDDEVDVSAFKERVSGITRNTELKLRNRLALERRKPRKLFPYYISAAVLLIVASITLLIFRNNQGVLSDVKDIAPGGNVATLSFSDGRQFSLQEAGAGLVATLDGLQISKTADGEIVLQHNLKDSASNKPVSYTTIRTPNGGHYKVRLPDGSYIYINAGSTLKVPSRFASGQRRVDLSGEAYFEVAHNAKRPFTVHTDQQDITVLGTRFNIAAYPQEQMKTALVSGKVEVRSKAGETVVLSPGQLATIENNNLVTREADVDAITGWTRNQFVFHRTTLKEIMRQLERWYGVQVDMNTIPDEQFYAEISRENTLLDVLRSLEKTSDYQFKLKERRIIVNKRKE